MINELQEKLNQTKLQHLEEINQQLKKIISENEKNADEQAIHYRNIIERKNVRTEKLSEFINNLEIKQEEMEDNILNLKAKLKSKASEIKNLQNRIQSLIEQKKHDRNEFERQISKFNKEPMDGQLNFDSSFEDEISKFVNEDKEKYMEKIGNTITYYQTNNKILKTQVAALETCLQKLESDQEYMLENCELSTRVGRPSAGHMNSMRSLSTENCIKERSRIKDNDNFRNLINSHDNEVKNLKSRIIYLETCISEREVEFQKQLKNLESSNDDILKTENFNLKDKVKELEVDVTDLRLNFENMSEKLGESNLENKRLLNIINCKTLEYDQIQLKHENLIQEYRKVKEPEPKPTSQHIDIPVQKNEVPVTKKKTSLNSKKNMKSCPNCSVDFPAEELQNHFNLCIDDEN